MATARIVQFGEDDCHRTTVLKGAGYAVEMCPSITDFRRALSAERPDAVVITEDGAATLEAMSAAKSGPPLPLILFANADDSYPDMTFDLVIPVLTSPSKWLAKIRETIERSRALRRETERLSGQAAELLSASFDLRVKSEAERARARGEYARNREFLNKDANRLDPDGEC